MHNPVEGAPYGEGLIGRITELERQLKVAREALGGSHGLRRFAGSPHRPHSPRKHGASR